MSALLSDFGPSPRDDLAALSTARLAPDDRPAAPGYPEPSPPGATWHVAGRAVHVRHTPGPEGSPETWYLHGLDGSSRNWDRLAASLADLSAGYAPDLPGSGLSGPPSHRGGYSLVKEASLVAGLIERSGHGPVHLVGNSRGGVVATYLAAQRPELVRTLTLVSPAVPDLRLTSERGADPRLALVMLPGAVRPAVRRLSLISPADRARGIAVSCFGEPEALTAADLDAAAADFAERATRPWADEATVRSLQSLIRAYFRPGRWSWAAAAGRVRVPTLVVWGTRDRLVDVRLAERSAAHFPDHRLLILPRTGHLAQMERPTVVARAMVALWEDAAGGCGRISVDGRRQTGSKASRPDDDGHPGIAAAVIPPPAARSGVSASAGAPGRATTERVAT